MASRILQVATVLTSPAWEEEGPGQIWSFERGQWYPELEVHVDNERESRYKLL